ncbi:MAG: pilus assembly protein [Actinomycetota bacterium]
MKRLLKDDQGTAVVEFVVLVVLVLVPVVYLVLGAMRVQAGAYAVTQAAREAGRAYVQADSPANGAKAARVATSLALADQGFESRSDSVVVQCDGPCLAPGSRVSVQVNLKVKLPFLPDSLADSTVGSVRVSADHVVPVDDYRSAQ